MNTQTKSVILFGKNKDSIETLVESAGFEIVEKNPDFVISFGGDGTVMRSESAYPGVPKIVLKDSLICKKCSTFSNEEVLNKVMNGSYTIEKLIKLEIQAKNKTLIASNDVTVHNRNPRHGIRYNISINNKPLFFKAASMENEVIGDGVVVSTPFGSTGYYRSITDSFFEVGIGLAFNNSIEQADHIVLKDDAVIELSITRGPAEVFADNLEESIELTIGDKVVIKKSDKEALLVNPI